MSGSLFICIAAILVLVITGVHHLQVMVCRSYLISVWTWTVLLCDRQLRFTRHDQKSSTGIAEVVSFSFCSYDNIC